MVSIVRNAWETLSASYWFIPAVLGVSAVLLSIGTLALDHRIGDDWIVSMDMRVFAPMQGEGARAVLTTIASSMITVAGVVFSLTLLVLTQASSQFGPRLLLNFMHDRTNQFMLGAFVATFAFALLVLRVVTDGDEGGASVAFVPQVSVLTALVLAFTTVSLLVYFFHHIAQSVRATHVLGNVESSLQTMIDDLPEPGEAESASEGVPTDFRDDVGLIYAESGGYLQSVAVKRLVKAASEHDAIVRILPTVGAFVTRGVPVAEVHPAAAVAALKDAVLRTIATGNDRSLTQDLGFVFDELLEIALRALSPSMNDPFTARSCIDRIAQGVLCLDGRGLPKQVHPDDDGVVRALVPLQSAGTLTRHLFAELRRGTRGNLLVTQHLLEALVMLRRHVRTNAIGSAVESEIEALMQDAETALPPGDRAQLVAVASRADDSAMPTTHP